MKPCTIHCENMTETITGLPYYHPDVSSSQEALEHLQKSLNQSGSFILRKRQNATDIHSHPYALTVVYSKTHIHHIKIELKKSKYCLAQDKWFSDLESLVKHYSNNTIPNGNEIPDLRLKHPVIYRPPKLQSQENKPTVPKRQISLPTVTEKDNRPERPPKVTEYLRAESDSQLREVAIHNFKIEDHAPQPPRPPKTREPAPVCQKTGELQEIYAQIYSRVQTPTDQLPQLIESLNISDQSNLKNVKCHCGIYVLDSQLPEGWTVHRSHEFASLFFESPSNSTSWTLPGEIQHLLTAEQKDTIKRLADETGSIVPIKFN